MSTNETLIGTTDRKNIQSDAFSESMLDATYVVVMAIILVLIFVSSFAGNTFVFLVFYKRPSLMTISNRFILNLSISNVLETVLVMPFVFSSLVTQEWQFGQAWCKVTGFVMNAVFAASTLTLVTIAIDRYSAVVTPLHYSMRMTTRRSNGLIAAVWLMAICCSTPPLLGWNSYKYQETRFACTLVSMSRSLSDCSYTIVLVLLCFILPLFTIVWVYCVIFRAARTNVAKIRRNSTIPNIIDDLSQTPLRNGRRLSSASILQKRISVSGRSCTLQIWRRDEWKAAVTSSMVVFTFIICWLPYFIIIIVECFVEDPTNIAHLVKKVSVLLAMSSCAFNPLVYVFRSKIQLAELKNILGLKSDRGKGYYLENNCSRRASLTMYLARDSQCITRQESEESDILVQSLRHVNTSTTLTSMIVATATN